MSGKRVLVAILARDKEATLPLYLECIEKLDYDKKDIVIYVRTNNNSDATEEILRSFISKNEELYSEIIFDNLELGKQLSSHHDWNAERFSVLGEIRKQSLNKALECKCDYYFVADCDNFILPHTLKSLMRFDVPIIAPFLVSDQGSLYSNFHYDVDENGYYVDSPGYSLVFSRTVIGVFKVKLVHCTYLIKSEYLNDLIYDDGSRRYEYVIFADSASKKNIDQYIDNTRMYGLITFKTKKEEMEGVNFENFVNPIHNYGMFNKS